MRYILFVMLLFPLFAVAQTDSRVTAIQKACAAGVFTAEECKNQLAKVRQSGPPATASPQPPAHADTAHWSEPHGHYTIAIAAAGSVSFQLANPTLTTTIGTGTLDGGATATFTGTAPAAGVYSVTATYTADSVYDVASSAAVSFTASSKSMTMTSVLSSAPTAGAGASVTLTATVTATGSGTPTGSVTFYDGNSTNGTLLGKGTLSGGEASVVTTSLALGTHSITAVYAGDASNASSTSAPFTEAIIAGNIALMATPSSLTVSQGSSATAVNYSNPERRLLRHADV